MVTEAQSLRLPGPPLRRHRRVLLGGAVAIGCGIVAGCVGRASSCVGNCVELQSRPGVTETVEFAAAPNPAASVVLFPGGDGVVADVQVNFLLRVRSRFVEQGISVAVFDAPSDQSAGMSTAYRTGAAQAQDVAAVVRFLKSKADIPVWLVGTSRGSISAASAAAQLSQQISGVVLTSSVWSATAPALGQIAVPTLIVHNRDDSCSVSSFAGAEAAVAQLTRAPAKELLAVSGGSLHGSPCDAISPHGYYQVEDKVVPPVIAWIKNHRQ
jgi:pimeloyl-ACP methyl ester carboxylesterase